MKKFLTVLFLTGLFTTRIAAAENPAKTAGAGRAILGINDNQKRIAVTAVTADGSAIQVEGCTVTKLPSSERCSRQREQRLSLKALLPSWIAEATGLQSLTYRG